MPDIYLLIEGKQEGPYTEEQIRQSIVDGSIQGDALAWREGLPEWIPLTGCLSKESFSPIVATHIRWLYHHQGCPT